MKYKQNYDRPYQHVVFVEKQITTVKGYDSYRIVGPPHIRISKRHIYSADLALLKKEDGTYLTIKDKYEEPNKIITKDALVKNLFVELI